MRYEPPPVNGRKATYTSPCTTVFVYSGQGCLTVTGPLTGIEYRFTGGGSALRVHPWDAASLAAVPGLMVVR
jgi:hypothetical protein